MGGVDVGGGGGGKRKSLDSEINMIPMIDLLMVTISFLLITAVWTHMSRINADAQVPGPPRPDVEQEKVEPEKQLHVMMQREDKFVLVWKQGSTTVDSIDVPRKDVVDRRRAASRSCASRTWRRRSRASGRPRASTRTRRTGSSIRPSCTPTTRPSSSTSSASSTRSTRRTGTCNLGAKTEKMPAFNITFAVN